MHTCQLELFLWHPVKVKSSKICNPKYLNVEEKLKSIQEAKDSATEMLKFALLSLIWNLAAYVVLLPSVACQSANFSPQGVQ